MIEQDWAEYPGGSSSIEDPGADLNYIGTGSFHKVNRNTRRQPKYSNEYTGDLGTVHAPASYDNFSYNIKYHKQMFNMLGLQQVLFLDIPALLFMVLNNLTLVTLVLAH